MRRGASMRFPVLLLALLTACDVYVMATTAPQPVATREIDFEDLRSQVKAAIERLQASQEHQLALHTNATSGL